MARRRDEFEGLDSAQEFTDDASAADLLSQYFGGMPADLPAAPEDTTALAQLRELVRMEEERRAAEAQATRPMGQDPVEAILPTGTSVNIAPPPATTGLPPGVTQADLDAIAAQFRQAGYQDTPPINFTGDPNQPFFDMRTPEGGVDPRYFVEGLTSPVVNTVRETIRGEDADPRCPPGMEYDYDARRCVRKEVVEPPRTTAPPVTTPPPTTEPPVTEPPVTTPPPTTAPPVTEPPATTPPPTTAPPRSCPPGYVYNPETRQCEAFLTSPPPTTAPPVTSPPPTTAPPTTPPPTTAPPSPTPPPTTRPPVTCPPGYALNAQGRCAPIDLGPCPAGYVRSTITGRCEPTTTGTPPPATTAPPATSAPPATTAPPTTTGPGCKQGEIFSTTLGRCVPITTEAPATTPPPATTTPPPGVITKFDPSAAMLEAYKRMFGTGVVNLGQSTPTTTGTTTSPLVGTTGITTPTPGSPAPTTSPIPLPGFKGVTFTPGKPQFFGPTGGLLPGTVPSSYNPFALYKGPNPVDVLQQNPNLTPSILGGLEGLGYYTDRLGNRILSPGGGFMRFAEGGEANKEEAASQSAQAELRALLDAMPAETETEVSVSPTARSVRRTKKKAVDTGKAKGISMSIEESMASVEPSSRASARDQLAALMRRNRNLAAKTFSAPTLAARGPLATRRFQEGGEVDDSTPLQRRIYMESVSDPAKRTAPITEKSMSARELEKLRKLVDIAERNPVLSEKTGKPLPGVVDYAHQRMLMEQVDPMGSLPISMRDSDYNALESGNLRNTLGQFTFERLPDGTLVVKDTYDYTGDVGERFNPLVRYANKKGVNRPVNIRIPPEKKR